MPHVCYVALSGVRVVSPRLRELGLVPGTKIRLVRRAPFGDPIEVAVRGSRLAMRQSEAKHIRVTNA
mgnify:CR=1 FL=1